MMQNNRFGEHLGHARDLCISAKKYFCNDADVRRARLELAVELESSCRKVNESLSSPLALGEVERASGWRAIAL
jgi:hypothetical protein